MADTVFLFIRAGIFMLFNDISAIVINGSTAYHTGLASAVHHKLIQIKTGLVLCYIFALLHLFGKKLLRSFVHPFIIGIHVIRQSGLRTVNPKKRMRCILHRLLCFFPVIYIIRQCRYLFRHTVGRTQRRKRSYCRHQPFLLLFTTFILAKIPIHHKTMYDKISGKRGEINDRR